MSYAVEVLMRAATLWITIFLQLKWAKNSLPWYDEYLFIWTIISSTVVFFVTSAKRPELIVTNKTSTYETPPKFLSFLKKPSNTVAPRLNFNNAMKNTKKGVTTATTF